MLAEVCINRSDRKYPLYVVKLTDETIITTIPKVKGEGIHLFSDDAFDIVLPSKTHTYVFEARLHDITVLNGISFYAFDIIRQSQRENVRKDQRTLADLPGVVNGFGDPAFSFANILDVSADGFRIRTEEPLKRRVLQLSYQNGLHKETKRVKVAWSKKTSDSYQYGLQTVF